MQTNWKKLFNGSSSKKLRHQKDSIFSGFFITRTFCLNPSNDDTATINVKLQIGKKYFWHIEWSLTGQLRSDFQSKPNFIRSFSHQPIDFSRFERKMNFSQFIFSEKTVFFICVFQLLQIMRIQSKLIQGKMWELRLMMMIFRWWATSTTTTMIPMTCQDLGK